MLKDADILEYDGEAVVQVMFTAGHRSLLGGSQPPLKQRRAPLTTAVPGNPGSQQHEIISGSDERCPPVTPELLGA